MITDYSNSTMLPIVTTYYGHIMLATPAKVRYIDRRHPKIHYCTVSFLRRKFDEETQLVYEHLYCTVKAWIGDNNTVHLMQPLPGETEFELDMSALFAATPEQEDTDEVTRQQILGELFD